MARNTSGLKKGGPGRPRGALNKSTREMKEVARALTLDNPRFVAKLRADLESGKAHPSVVTTLFHYGYGKPTEQVDINMSQPVILELYRGDDQPTAEVAPTEPGESVPEPGESILRRPRVPPRERLEDEP